MHVYLCVCVCTCMLCIWRSDVNIRFLAPYYYHFFLKTVLTGRQLALSLSPVSSAATTWVCRYTTSTWVLRIKLRCSCLHGYYFSDWAWSSVLCQTEFKGAICHRHRLGQVGLGLWLPRALLITFLLSDSTFIKFCVYIFTKGTWSMITGGPHFYFIGSTCSCWLLSMVWAIALFRIDEFQPLLIIPV